MRVSGSLLFIGWVAGCAQGVPAAGEGGDRPDAAAGAPDGAEPGTPDAPPGTVVDAGSPDANPGPITLSQTTSAEITTGAYVCQNGSRNHFDNSYYRAFELGKHGVTGAFAVTKVAFGVFAARGGTQKADVRLHKLTGGTPSRRNLTQLGTTQIEIPTTSKSMIEVPIAAEVPAGSTLVVELALPNTLWTHGFDLGANTDAESAPGYWMSEYCSEPEMVAFGSGGLPRASIVLTVTGTPR